MATLTINTHGDGSVTLNPPGGVYALHTDIIVTAVPGIGSHFGYWTDGMTGVINPETYHIHADTVIDAWFGVDGLTPLNISQNLSIVVETTALPPTSTINVNLAESSVKTKQVKNFDIDGALLNDVSVGFTNYLAEANNDTINDVRLLPNAPAMNDLFYYGINTITENGILADFIRYVIDIGTAGAGVWSYTLEYWNGAAWTAIVANIEYISNQFLNHRTAGLGSLWINPPANWTANAVNGITKFWLRERVSFTNKTVIPLATRIYSSMVFIESGYKRLVNYPRAKTLIGR